MSKETNIKKAEREKQELMKDRKFDDLNPLTVSTSLYMHIKEISQKPLLTRKEEIELTELIFKGNQIKKELKELEEAGDKLPDEEKKELEEIVFKSEIAKSKLVESNLRLVISIAKKYINRGMDFQDLIQEGHMGLIRSVDKFIPSKGYKFSTYATWWIRQGITRGLADQSRTIRVPVHMVETIGKFKKKRNKYIQEHDEEPSMEKMAELMDMPLEKVKFVRKSMQEAISLETPISSGEEKATIQNFVAGDADQIPENIALKDDRQKEVDKFLHSELEKREVEVIKMRFGFVNGIEYTLGEIGIKLNLTKERVRQINKEAMSKLQNSPNSAQLRKILTNTY